MTTIVSSMTPMGCLKVLMMTQVMRTTRMMRITSQMMIMKRRTRTPLISTTKRSWRREGLNKIQIEGEEEEFLMDAEGNIYNLNGDFIGTTNGDADDNGDDDGDDDE
mmetsp:Transcript_38385/g.43987  ORF Transcript_38385/g.43987 Transcript_38385/m.43987 type:complete len:107 (-) Transcript_38385:7-327(-)